MNRWSRSWLKGWKLLLPGYAVLLLCSHLWQLADSPAPLSDNNRNTVELKKISGGSVLPGTSLTLRYADIYEGPEEHPPVVVVLQESPERDPESSQIISELSSTFRVISPVLPGYDASTPNIPDHSVRAYALYVEQLLDKLEIGRVHTVGYSLGGGVALNLAHFNPQRIKSVTLLSAVGVQELHLMGSYLLNHTVHGVQLALFWLLNEGVPHFGLIDYLPVDMSYARCLYDSDQRPIRAYLQQYKRPMLIQHGKEDRLVPLVAAQEHHRIVPQSSLILYDGRHDIISTHADALTADLIRFITRVERNEATTYAEATPERIKQSKKTFENVDFAKFEGFSLFVIMFIIALATLISEDLTCIGAGLMAARGLIGFWPAAAACFAGILVGDMGLYLIGRWLGKPALRRAPMRWFLSEKDLEKSADWFKAQGPTIIVASRFLPGSRLPTYFSAGVIGAGFWMFTFYFLLATVIWIPALVGLSMLLGTRLIHYLSVYHDYALWILPGMILLLIIVVKTIVPAFSYRGRRLLISRYRRWTDWEFWPPYILYVPVCGYITYLWLKYRCLTIFTAANPGIVDGGFMGESKKQIFDLFRSTGLVGRYRFLPAEWPVQEKLEKALAFMDKENLTWPVVIKPDVGRRSRGVTFVRNEKQLCKALKQTGCDLIVQEYLKGREYGIFYYRYPHNEQGRIFSITVKKIPVVTGDGKRTLEELILNDDRAVCMAGTYLKNCEDKLFDVPAAGVDVPLAEVGSHACGALFEDGTHLITEDLQRAVDEISQTADGFYFGRYDICAPSEEDLKAGRNLKIVEVNGVTSESTNIYDVSISFMNAQRILMNQWRIAFEIGHENVKTKGEPFSPAFTLIKKLLTPRAK